MFFGKKDKIIQTQPGKISLLWAYLLENKKSNNYINGTPFDILLRFTDKNNTFNVAFYNQFFLNCLDLGLIEKIKLTKNFFDESKKHTTKIYTKEDIDTKVLNRKTYYDSFKIRELVEKDEYDLLEEISQTVLEKNFALEIKVVINNKKIKSYIKKYLKKWKYNKIIFKPFGLFNAEKQTEIICREIFLKTKKYSDLIVPLNFKLNNYEKLIDYPACIINMELNGLLKIVSIIAKNESNFRYNLKILPKFYEKVFEENNQIKVLTDETIEDKNKIYFDEGKMKLVYGNKSTRINTEKTPYVFLKLIKEKGGSILISDLKNAHPIKNNEKSILKDLKNFNLKIRKNLKIKESTFHKEGEYIILDREIWKI